MEMARLASTRSTCSRNAVGAVFALEGRVLSTGYNGAAAGLPHCEHPCTCSKIYRQARRVPSLHQSDCVAIRPCDITVHAEANAVAFAARHGVALLGATLYTTLSPCLTCAKLVVNAGVAEVFVNRFYRDPAGINLLRSAEVACTLLA